MTIIYTADRDYFFYSSFSVVTTMLLYVVFFFAFRLPAVFAPRSKVVQTTTFNNRSRVRVSYHETVARLKYYYFPVKFHTLRSEL